MSALHIKKGSNKHSAYNLRPTFSDVQEAGANCDVRNCWGLTPLDTMMMHRGETGVPPYIRCSMRSEASHRSKSPTNRPCSRARRPMRWCPRRRKRWP